MGAAESVIRNTDKRTARRENRKAFVAGIEEFRKSSEFENANQNQGNDSENNANIVNVYVRKRPIFEHESKKGEFDVVSCQRQHIVVHDARMQADMIGRFLDHNFFKFDKIFSEIDDSNAVYETVVSPLVHLVKKGGNGTVLMFGQTGSGKTYTMTHIYKRAAQALFRDSLNERGEEIAYLSFTELVGEVAYDGLNQNKKLQITTCSDGNVMAYPSVQVPAKNAEELIDYITFCCSIRSTAATGVHDQSSRSHAIARIEMANGNALTLVDLAGSEKKIDSDKHNAQRRKESAQINSSLMKLKECIRARANKSSYVPYRQSKLTLLLRPSFVDEGRLITKTSIIATLSPSSKDTEHSLNTLRHACIMDGQSQESHEQRWLAGGEVLRQELEPVNVTALAREQNRKKKLNAIKKQKSSMGSWSTPPSQSQARDGSFDKVAEALSAKKAAKEAAKQRRKAENLSFQKMREHTREKLLEARNTFGQRQRMRLRKLTHLEANKCSEGTQKSKFKKISKAANVSKTVKKNTSRGLMPKDEQYEDQNNFVYDGIVDGTSILGQQKQTSKPSKLSLDRQKIEEIRRLVWNDNSIPDDGKEETIVDMIRSARKALEINQNDHNPATENSCNNTPRKLANAMQNEVERSAECHFHQANLDKMSSFSENQPLQGNQSSESSSHYPDSLVTHIENVDCISNSQSHTNYVQENAHSSFLMNNDNDSLASHMTLVNGNNSNSNKTEAYAESMSTTMKNKDHFRAMDRSGVRSRSVTEAVNQPSSIDSIDKATSEFSRLVNIPSISRHEQAKRTRDLLIQKEKSEFEAKMKAKWNRKKSCSLDSRKIDEMSLQKEIFEIQNAISKETNKMKTYALKQKLARAKAIQLERQKSASKKNSLPLENQDRREEIHTHSNNASLRDSKVNLQQRSSSLSIHNMNVIPNTQNPMKVELVGENQIGNACVYTNMHDSTHVSQRNHIEEEQNVHNDYQTFSFEKEYRGQNVPTLTSYHSNQQFDGRHGYPPEYTDPYMLNPNTRSNSNYRLQHQYRNSH